MQACIQLGDFAYDVAGKTLRLPAGLGETTVNFGFCSGTNWRYCFPDQTEAIGTEDGIRLQANSLFIPPRLGHGGIVCYHRPEYPQGLTIDDAQGTVELRRTESGFDAVLSGQATAGIKNAFVHLKHFPPQAEILVPWKGGCSIRDIPPGTIHVWEYPDSFGWAHQFAIFQHNRAGMLLRFDDPHYSIKRLVLSTLEPEHGLQIGVYVAPVDGKAPSQWSSPPIKFESFNSGWESAAKRYRDWLEFQQGLKPFRSTPAVAERLRDIALFVNLRGHNWGPFIYNTFDQMCQRLDELAQYIEPRFCAAYIEGYDGGYLPPCTDFMPGAELGGAEGFKRLIDHAHRLGYLLVPYVHTHVLHEAHPQFERFKNSTFTQWSTDFDGDGVAERMFWNMRADDQQWNELQLLKLERFLDSFAVDGLLLDQICIPVPHQGPDQYMNGCRQFLGRLTQMLPQGSSLLTEGLGEPYLDIVRMGMTPVHSRAYATTNARARDMLFRPEHVRFHPVQKYVTNYFARLIGHSSMRAAEEEQAHEYQARCYAELGAIPILNLHRGSIKLKDSKLLLADIQRAREIAQHNESLEYDPPAPDESYA